MNKSKIIPAGIFTLLGFIIFFVLIIPGSLTLLGYKVDASGSILGKEAATKGKVDLCSRIIVYHSIFGPPTGERRAECIRTYAEIKKDPKVCENLMPSSYGLSCTGGAMRSLPCSIYTKDEIRWEENNKGMVTGLNECAQKASTYSEYGQQCCKVAINRFVLNENDCSQLPLESDTSDQCHYEVAFKNHDPSYCENISDANIKAGCLVSAKALQQDPSICTGCTQPVESIEDL